MEYIRRYWRSVVEELGRSKLYMVAAIILFALGVYAGFVPNETDDILKQTVETAFGNLHDQIAQSDNPTQASILFIFINNVRAILLMMVLGIIFAIMPVISMILNGAIIGFVLRMLNEAGHSLPDLIFKGLLPHGLLELPAVFIAAGYGIRLGATVIMRISPKMRDRMQTVGQVLRSGVPLFGLLVVLLLVAAIVESTLTVWLLGV